MFARNEEWVFATEAYANNAGTIETHGTRQKHEQEGACCEKLVCMEGVGMRKQSKTNFHSQQKNRQGKHVLLHENAARQAEHGQTHNSAVLNVNIDISRQHLAPLDGDLLHDAACIARSQCQRLGARHRNKS